MDGHSGDCTIFSALANDRPGDGICTCGFGLRLMRNGDSSQMFSQEILNRPKIAAPTIREEEEK